MGSQESTLNSKRTAFGIALISAIQLGVELLFIKLSRYEFGTLSLGVLGLAMLGVALASPLAKLLGGTEKATQRALLALPISLFVSGWYLVSLSHQITDMESLYVRILIAGLLCLVSLSLSSVPTYTEIIKSKGSVFHLYAASLLGATLGVPFAFLGMYLFGDIPTLIAHILICALAFWALVPRTYKWWGPGMLQVLAFTALASVVFYQADQLAHPDSIFIKTNAFSRIDVKNNRDGSFLFRTAGINGGTSTALGPVSNPPKNLIYGLSALPFHVDVKDVLILGTGAGKNVTQALYYGAKRVVAVEINEMIPEFMAENLAAEDDPYRDPRVELVVAEGREYAARLEERGEKFDMVYVPIATLFGSSGHALTQTYLMSTEAMSLYFKMLKPGGYVAIYFKSVIADKLLDAVTKALGKEGISDRLPHLAAFNQGGGFVLLARPSEAISPVVRQKLYQAQPAKSVYNITQGLARAKKLHHLSDDNPFLYNDGALLSRHRALFGYNVDFMKYILMFTSVLIFLVFLTSIKNASSGAKRSRSAYLAAFVIMGVAYSMYQTGMIQRLMFLVGHPLLATSLVLPAMLAGTALGSFSSKRIFETKHALMRGLITLFLLVAIAGFALTEPIELILPNWSIWQRCALALVLSGIPSIMMGTYFPVVFNRLETVDEKGPLWAWLTNGLGGVLGSVLGIFAAMFLGFSLTILLVIPLYGLLSLWDATSNSNGNIAKLIDGLMSFMLLLGLGYILFISIV